MWDNPRYRVAFIGLQVSLAAWVWIEQRRAPDPWFRRAIVAIGAILLWFFPWYLRRYYGLQWPVEDLFLTLGLGICTAALYWIWDWARERKKRGLGKANNS
jgi:CDP-diglyceride synthetase